MVMDYRVHASVQRMDNGCERTDFEWSDTRSPLFLYI